MAVGVVSAGAIALALIGLAALFILGSSRILPNVSAAGVPLGGMTVETAADQLSQPVAIRALADQMSLSLSASDLGIRIDARASAEAASRVGRPEGGLTALLQALFGEARAPVAFSLDVEVARAALMQIAAQIDTLPINAGIDFVSGAFQPRPAVFGRAIDVEATLARLINDPTILDDGAIELVMTDVPPPIADAAPLVAAASRLIAAPLTLEAYDPIDDRAYLWPIAPEIWGAWLLGQPDPGAPLGLRFSFDADALTGWLAGQTGTLPSARTLRPEEAVAALETALNTGTDRAVVRVYHEPILYTVQPGDSIISIAYDYGIPYPYLQQANPGVDALTPGQTITLPSRDVMLPEPVVFGKRIVVSIPEQRVRVYENGALLWDWIASTGIPSSPTWPGVYQILSHEPNAYAGNWNLWMPNFMGVYRPIPGADFTNGFHGFPTRGGSQLLWTGDLGRRVTYGCILLGSREIELLYNWAEVGVVVEIQG
jgi:lipoprotein-anchoring transpeptidase ErfK/SrfK